MRLSASLTRWLALALLLHLLAGVLSAGFLHTDEHFQTLEFLNFKLGGTPAAELPVEFQRAMRPWLQPCLYGLIAVAHRTLGIENPFTWAISFRLFSALLGWMSLVALALCAERLWFRDHSRAARAARTVAIASTALLWYLPALHARLSSENLGGALLLLGVCAYLLDERRRTLTARGVGLVFGLAFEARYQVGAMVAGFVAWMALIERAPARRWLDVLLGAGLAVAACTALDAWGYGRWVFAPWNYVQYNLLEGHGRAVGAPAPLGDFFRRALTETWPPLGLLLLVAFVIAWIRNPRHPLTWATLPLFLVHHALGHKELRFLFPIAHAGPVLLALAIADSPAPILPRTLITLIGRFAAPARVAFLCLAGWNTLALLISSALPVWAPIRLYEWLWEAAPAGLHYVGESPYSVLGSNLHFYRPRQLGLIGHASFDALPDDQDLLLFHRQRELPMSAGLAIRQRCNPAFSSLPAELVARLPGRLLERANNWTLFRCTARPLQSSPHGRPSVASPGS